MYREYQNGAYRLKSVVRDGSVIDLLIPLLADPPDLSALQDQASWKTVREQAGRYGVAALVAYAARKHASPAERAWCDRVLIDGWTRYERMLRHLEFVIALLAEAGIPTIALKGPLLAQRYYKPVFLRKPSIDLDLAVTEQDLEAACNALIKVGYTLDVPISEAKAMSHHVALSNPARARLELHFRLSHQSRGIPVNEFFERAVPRRLPSGREVLVLGPADQLLHLALHLAHSRFGTLFNLHELRRVCGVEPLSVRVEAIQRAVDHHFCGVLRMVDVAFRVHFGERFLPPEVAIPKTWLSWRLNEKLYEQFERSSEPGLGLTLPVRLRARWLEFQITDGPADAISSLKLLAQTARFRIAGRAWGKIKDISYGPDYSQ
jgi:hypothetical protein